MKTIRPLIIAVIAWGVAGFANAQNTHPPADQGAASKDPYVERRNEKSAAKKQYKARQISKEEYEQDKKEAKTNLKKSGAKAPVRENVDIVPVGAGAAK